MSDNLEKDISPTRLRVGITFIFIWWIPIWVIAPQLADFFGFNSNNARIVIIIIQTIIGIIGGLIVGKQIASLMKSTPFKKMLPTVWKILRYGTVE
jgi:hypothetical protein